MTIKGKTKLMRNIIIMFIAIIMLFGVTAIVKSATTRNIKVTFNDNTSDIWEANRDETKEWILNKEADKFKFTIDLTDYLNLESGNIPELEELLSFEMKTSNSSISLGTEIDPEFSAKEVNITNNMNGTYDVIVGINNEGLTEDYQIFITFTKVSSETGTEPESDLQIPDGEFEFKITKDMTNPEITFGVVPDSIVSVDSISVKTNEDTQLKVQLFDIEDTSVELFGLDKSGNECMIPMKKGDEGVYGDGTFKIVATAVDKAGNTSQSEVIFTFNASIPTILVNGQESIKDFYNINDLENGLIIEIEDGNKIDQSITEVVIKDSVGYELAKKTEVLDKGKKIKFIYEFIYDGIYTIEVKAKDSITPETGNIATINKEFKVDTKATDVKTIVDGVEKDKTHFYLNNDADKKFSVDFVDTNFTEIVLNADNKDENKNYLTIEKLVGENKYEKYNATLSILDIIDKSDDAVILGKVAEFTIDENGTYKVTVEASDQAGNITAVKELNFTVDKDAATVVFGDNIKSDEHYKTNMTLNIALEDDNLDLSLGKNVVKIKLNDTLIETINFDTGKATFTKTFTTEGNYEVTVESIDLAGNKVTGNNVIKFVIDKTVPIIVMSQYNELNGKYITEVKDIISTITEENLAEDISITFTKIAPVPDEDGNLSILNKGLEDKLVNQKLELLSSEYFTQNSDYYLAFTIKDKAGNIAILKDTKGNIIDTKDQETIQLGFTIDKKEAEIKIETFNNEVSKILESGTFLGMNNSKKVRFTITDANLIDAIGSGGEANNIKVTETDLNTKIQTTYTDLNFNEVQKELNGDRVTKLVLEHDFSVAAGEEKEYTINITSTDKADNEATVENFIFTVDNKAPVIVADKLEADIIKYFKKDMDKNININITDNNLADKDVEGNDLNTVVATFKKQDNKGDTNFDEYKVDAVTIDGGKAVFTHNFNMATEDSMDAQVYKLVVKATDKAGNTSDVTYNFEVDNGIPTVIFDGVKDGEYFGLGTDGNKVNREIAAVINDINVYEDEENINKYNTITVNRYNQYTGEDIPETVGKFVKSDNGQVKLPMSFTENGVYTITVNSIDKAGNTVEKSVKFTIDNDPVVINVTGLENGKQYYSINRIPLTIKLTDRNHGLENTNNKITIVTENLKGKNEEIFNLKDHKSESDEERKFIVKENGEIEFKYNFEEEATYTVNIQTVDLAGNTSKETVAFTIDRTTPVVNIENYDDLNSSFKQTASNLIFTVEEENFRDDKILTGNGAIRIPYTLDVKYDKETPEDDKDITNSDLVFTQVGDKSNLTTYKIDATKFVDAAKYTVKINVQDAAGNKGVLQISKDETSDDVKVEFTTDTVAPKIDIYFDDMEKTDAELKATGVHEYQSKNIKITTYDVNHDKNEIKINHNGKEYSAGFAGEGRVRTFEHKFIEEGNYTVTATSKDLSGRVTTRSFSFIIDTTKPVISIENFTSLNNSYNNPGKSLKVIVDELNFTYNKVNVDVKKILEDTTVVPASLSFANNGTTSVNEYSIFGDDARYEVTISATDLAGNKAEEKHLNIAMTTDTTRPVATITGIENTIHYNVDKTVTVSVVDVNHDINIVTITKDGKQYFESKEFSLSGDTNVKTATLSKVISEEGEYVVTVYSKDKAGNELGEVVTRIFTIDKTAPKITSLFRGENREIKNGEFINKIFTPEFKLDEQDDWFINVTLNDKNVTSSIPMASAEMKYDYSGIATDKAGNTTPFNISFTVDTTNPDVNISGITSGFFAYNMKPEYEIKDTNLNSDKTNVLLNDNVFVSGTTINKEEHYNLKALATDLADNVTSRNITFAIDKTGPVISFIEPISGQYYTNDIIPNFLIDDLTDYTIVAMTLDGQEYFLGDPITEEGKHVLFVEVKDQAGNPNSLTLEFILDKTMPKFIVNGLVNKEKYYEAIAAEIKLDNPEDTITSITVNGELANGEVKEEFGQQVIKLNFYDINEYEVVLKAKDEAGNVTEQVINFEIAKKSIFISFYQNKGIFYPTLAIGSVAVVLTGVSMFKRRKIVKKVEEDTEE